MCSTNENLLNSFVDEAVNELKHLDRFCVPIGGVRWHYDRFYWACIDIASNSISFMDDAIFVELAKEEK